MTATPIRWLAAEDGMAHAYRGAAPRALCGGPVILERLAWPEKWRCVPCQFAAAGGPQEAVARRARAGARMLIEQEGEA